MLVTSEQLTVPNGVTAVTFAKIEEVAMSETFLLKLSLAHARITLHFFEHCKCCALKVTRPSFFFFGGGGDHPTL